MTTIRHFDLAYVVGAVLLAVALVAFGGFDNSVSEIETMQVTAVSYRFSKSP